MNRLLIAGGKSGIINRQANLYILMISKNFDIMKRLEGKVIIVTGGGEGLGNIWLWLMPERVLK